MTEKLSYNLKTKEPLVSVIVLNYNGRELLRKCLQSIFRTNYLNYEVIVVDNGSSDESGTMVERDFPRSRLIRNQRNFGYSKGNNVGILSTTGEFVVLLNNDTTVHSEWLSELIKEAIKNKMCFHQPKILISGTNKINSAGNFIQLFGFAFPRGVGEVDTGEYDKTCEVSYASGACVLGSRMLVEDVGLLDECFFTFYEDVNWGWRTLMRGHKTVYVPSAVVYHEWGASWGRNMSHEKFSLIERSRIASIFRNYSSKSLTIMLPGLAVAELFVFSYCLKSGFLRDKVNVYADLIRLRRLLAIQRREMQLRRKVPDEYVFHYFSDGLTHVYLGAFAQPVNKLLSFAAKTIKLFVRQ